MTKPLPSRPNLDHLRGQAKSLLASLRAGDDEAARTFIQHLPATKTMSAAKVKSAGFRLADAQSAIARKSGFAGWPALSRHVTELRGLEGTWEFTSLEIEGSKMPRAMLGSSRLIIDGDVFRTESPEAIYEGVFNIDVEADPPRIDIEFVRGPEAGNWSYGIYELQGDALTICLGLTGAKRPAKFVTTPGSRHALETLVRRHAGAKRESAPVDFEPSTPEALKALAGTWIPLSIVIDGSSIPANALAYGQRIVEGNRTRITFGGPPMLDGPTKATRAGDGWEIDYLHTSGPSKGQIQRALVRLAGDELESCMAPPGAPRPTRFDGAKGTGWTLSRWRRA